MQMHAGDNCRHCYRPHYPRRPAQYITSVKPARSEATWQLVKIKIEKNDPCSRSIQYWIWTSLAVPAVVISYPRVSLYSVNSIWWPTWTMMMMMKISCRSRMPGPIYKISYGLSQDYLEFIVRSTWGPTPKECRRPKLIYQHYLRRFYDFASEALLSS